MANLGFLGVDYLIPIGGDDTLSYGRRLHDAGVKVVGIPKTMDNDVPGTDYCIGFSTCVTRTIALTHELRTCAGSHERMLVLEVFGRYAGFTAAMPTLAGAADRCLIPEYPFDIEHVTELLVDDRNRNPNHYAVVLVSEGARMQEQRDMVFEGSEQDQYGHRKLGGIGDQVASRIKDLSPKFNRGRRINVLSQRLGYLVRCGAPDALDSLVPTAFGNLALDAILAGKSGLLVSLRDGRYDLVPIGAIAGAKKTLDVEQHYHTERLRPKYEAFLQRPLFVITRDG
jgi:6-phosphofructokinase 1